MSSVLTHFLNNSTNNILGLAAGMAIGSSFKDLITSIVSNCIQPLVINFILLINIPRLTKIINMDPLFSEKNNILNFSNAIVSIFSFICIVITVYAIVELINRLGSTAPTSEPLAIN